MRLAGGGPNLPTTAPHSPLPTPPPHPSHFSTHSPRLNKGHATWQARQSVHRQARHCSLAVARGLTPGAVADTVSTGLLSYSSGSGSSASELSPYCPRTAACRDQNGCEMGHGSAQNGARSTCTCCRAALYAQCHAGRCSTCRRNILWRGMGGQRQKSTRVGNQRVCPAPYPPSPPQEALQDVEPLAQDKVFAKCAKLE